MFSQESHEETARKSLRNSSRSSFIFLTRDLTAVKLEPQRDAVLPRLGSDSYETGQDRLWDTVEDHLCGVSIGMENLYIEKETKKIN